MAHQSNDLPQRYRPPDGRRHQQGTVEARVREQSWPGTLMALGIFVLITSFWAAAGRTLVSYVVLARWFALFAFAGNLLPYSRVGLRSGMERLEWFLFNLLAVGPFVFSLLLWLNLLVHGPERFSITGYNGDIIQVRSYWMVHGRLPPGEPFSSNTGSIADHPGPVGGHFIGTATGLLGYEVITTYTQYATPAGASDQ